MHPEAEITEERGTDEVLLVEDESNLAFTIILNLESAGYTVDHAKDGNEALEKLASGKPYRIAILDVMLPGVDGFEILRQIRANKRNLSVLMLSALSSTDNRIRGLERGADDYLTKPFHMRELLLRMKNLLARKIDSTMAENALPPSLTGTKDRIIEWQDFQLNVDALTLQGPQGEFELTAMEADVLSEFLLHPGKVLSRQYLLTKVWGIKGSVETRTVDNFIVRLRRFLEVDPKIPRVLRSIRGRGYVLSNDDQDS